jgi:long-chain acyl-CoA synthetase
MRTEAKRLNIEIVKFADATADGQADVELEETKPDSDYMFSYTSGTTGDPKGVRLNHTQILTVVDATMKIVPVDEHSRVISYLPYPHSFEQCMLGMAFVSGCKVGYYSGNPANISDDCQKLKPTTFPSVPRLYQRIHASVKAKMDALTGCTKWIADKAFAAKTHNLLADASYTHACYDALVFNKMKAAFGGELTAMVTGSAPIDLELLTFLKVCFCCPLMEGYGLTETAGASTITHPNDPVMGHVGGPLECVKFRLKDVPAMNYFSTDKPYARGEICMRGSNVT